MSERVVWGAIIAAVWALGCGGRAKPEHGDRNDALGETKDQTTTVAATNDDSPSSVGTSPAVPTSTVSTSTTSAGTSVTQAPHPTPAGSATSVPSGSGLMSETHDAVDVTDSSTTYVADAGSAIDSSDSTADDGASGKACGARAGDSCTANEYCAYVPGEWCGQADAEATCKLRPESCTADYNPVCGCDGKTYSNACTAASAGSGVFEEGACEDPAPEPVDCETIQCFRAITCAESCTSEVVQAGCCPCPEGLIDTFVECSEQTPEQ